MERLAPGDSEIDRGRDDARRVSERGTLSLPDAACTKAQRRAAVIGIGSARLSAFQAAWQRVSVSLCSRAAGISTVSMPRRDMDKPGGRHRARRTAAMASLKVGSRLPYQAAVRVRTAPVGARASSSAQTATKENNPSSAGVVRRMARSDHCRYVSTPRWARISWNVVSMRQRETNQPRMRSGVAARSVLRNACGSLSPEGSRTSAQRIGAGGRPE